MLISTPYYRTINNPSPVGCSNEQDMNFNPFDLFCLKTRLYPEVNSLFKENVDMKFIGIKDKNKMGIKVLLESDTISNQNEGITSYKLHNNIFTDDNDPCVLTETEEILTDKVNQITSEYVGYCLIDRNTLYLSSGKHYPRGWFNSVLEYINLPTEYNPFIAPEGIYLTFNPLSDYIEAYNKVVKIILNTIDKYYNDGVVYGANNISIDWKLERIDNDEIIPKLFRPTWKDNRFAPNLVDFLLNKIRGDEYIKIKVSDNLFIRHNIAYNLHSVNINMMYDRDYIKVKVKDMDQAQHVASIVELSNLYTYPNSNKYQVLTIPVNSGSVYKLHLYTEAIKSIFEIPKYVIYQIMDMEDPYIFSCLIDKHLSVKEVSDKLKYIVKSLQEERRKKQ